MFDRENIGNSIVSDFTNRGDKKNGGKTKEMQHGILDGIKSKRKFATFLCHNFYTEVIGPHDSLTILEL